MRASLRAAVATICLVLVLLTGEVLASPSVCLDGCDEGSGAACADCPVCSPGRAPVVLGPSGNASQPGPVSPHDTAPSIEPSRIEERDVFHVPRTSA
jgi:hypothetical protein